MSDVRVGQLIKGAAQRDAIHVAIMPVVAGDGGLRPGASVCVGPDGTADPPGRGKRGVGIVDPFLKRRVAAGDQCWIFLYPGTITSLRHDWTHPEIDATSRSVEERLRDLCRRQGTTLETVIDAIYTDGHSGVELTFEANDEFWALYTLYNPDYNGKKYRHFTCSC